MLGMKTAVLVFTACWLIVVANAVAANAQQLQQQQPQTLNYKQQLQYQMQQHDKFQYQQHIKQQQQYYQQQHHPQPSLASMALEQHQQQQRIQQHQQFLPVKPTQMLKTAPNLAADSDSASENLGQPEYINANVQRRRASTRKRKRRPQLSSAEIIDSPIASNAPPYWRGQVENDKESINASPYATFSSFSISTKNPQTAEDVIRPTMQASFKRRKQPALREPLAALEKEQKLYEVRNKPETTSTGGNTNLNSANLKNILKNNGGLSLSEILQQKNLSLDDLLKGKQNALQALQTTATSPQENSNHAKHSAFKPNFKPSTASAPANEDHSEEVFNSKDKAKLSALQRLKLFGSSSRPSGLPLSLTDHPLTTRKREGGLYTTTATTTITKSSTTKIPLYKKILHQRPTLKPTFLLKNTLKMATSESPNIETSGNSKEHQLNINNETAELQEEVEEPEPEAEDEEYVEQVEDAEDDLQNEAIEESSTKLPETTTWRMDTTTSSSTTTTTTTSTTTSTTKPTTQKAFNDLGTTSTRRMFTNMRGPGRMTYRFTSSTNNPATITATTPKPTTTTTTTTTTEPMTTTTPTTSTTTASSSTMNLTPKANANINTEDLRERIQETLLKNLIEKEDSHKKSPPTATIENDDGEDDLENFFEETVKPSSTSKYSETSTITTRMKQYTPSFFYTSSTTTAPTTPTENVNVIPDFDNVDDRTDLLELIEDRRSGNRLFKVLEQRNMTLEELIEHRKRGSSQLHLATIVESPSRFYPDKKVVLQDNMDIVTAFENFPHFNLLNLKSVKPDDIKTDSQGSSYFTSIIDIEPTDDIYKKRKGGQTLTADLEKASLLADRSEKSLGFFPYWKTLALASLGTADTIKDAAVLRKTDTNPYFLEQPKMLLENNSESNDSRDADLYDIKENEVNLIGGNDSGDESDYQGQNPIQAAVRLPDRTAEAIENEVARAHDLVDLELSGHGFKRNPQASGIMAHSHRRGTFYTNMPPGIKSAIVASATIVLTALVTFMVIFAVCKWRQRRHRMTNIMKSYNAMKSKLPTIAATSTVALNAPNSTNPNSRRSSFREMQGLLGGSGLSVAATITTSTGAPNTPTHLAKLNSPPVNNNSQPTKTVTGQCSKNPNNLKQHGLKTASNSSGSSSSKAGLRPLKRQSSLLFQHAFNPNSDRNNEKPTNLSILSGCNLLDIKRNSKMSGSTTSLSFSLTSGHNISNSHINTMDANSPEVQEYLFDTLRSPF